MKSGSNVIKYKKGFQFNIGFAIFAIIVIYMILSIAYYLSKDTVAEYEVIQGSIASNNIYQGLILRSETICYSNQSGDINYYVKNANRVSVHDVIYSLDTTGDLANQISTVSSDGRQLSEESLEEISQEIDSFTNSYQPMRFSYASSFKNDLNSEMTQILNNQAMQNLSDQISKAENDSTFFTYTPDQVGYVLYYIDGYEDITPDTFTANDMNASGYTKTSLDTNSSVVGVSPVYKLVTDETFDVMVEINKDTYDSLGESGSIKTRFCKDDYTAYASYTTRVDSNRYFVDLNYRTAMVRYINERYIDIELVLNDKTGLKIPNSSITTKEFFTVPEEDFMQGNDSDDLGLLIRTYEDSVAVDTFVTPTIYYEKDGMYYIDSEDVSSGDAVVIGDSEKTYIIGTDTATLQGVYNINKGYAVFKQINVIYANEEYSIVEAKTAYGISLYDHIALDGSKLKEDDLIAK